MIILDPPLLLIPTDDGADSGVLGNAKDVRAASRGSPPPPVPPASEEPCHGSIEKNHRQIYCASLQHLFSVAHNRGGEVQLTLRELSVSD